MRYLFSENRNYVYKCDDNLSAIEWGFPVLKSIDNTLLDGMEGKEVKNHIHFSIDKKTCEAIPTEKWTSDKVKEKLKEAHELENTYNKEMGAIDIILKERMSRKKKLQKLISNNMRYRNHLSKML